MKRYLILHIYPTFSFLFTYIHKRVWIMNLLSLEFVVRLFQCVVKLTPARTFLQKKTRALVKQTVQAYAAHAVRYGHQFSIPAQIFTSIHVKTDPPHTHTHIRLRVILAYTEGNIRSFFDIFFPGAVAKILNAL